MRNIAEFLRSDKVQDFGTALIIVAVGVGGFALGRLSLRATPPPPLEVARAPWAEAVSAASSAPAVEEMGGSTRVPAGRVVGSVNGSVYHLPWCAGAARIKEENRRWFASAEEAKRAGYRPAANCPGISPE